MHPHHRPRRLLTSSEALFAKPCQPVPAQLPRPLALQELLGHAPEGVLDFKSALTSDWRLALPFRPDFALASSNPRQLPLATPRALQQPPRSVKRLPQCELLGFCVAARLRSGTK